ncbi:hypothetical protein HDU76_008548 [Blyttiomyces sp. JEL0837]|nr:hypothetical protein HDU76_008548 [Blyttiomyces sp. JEL0837]
MTTTIPHIPLTPDRDLRGAPDKRLVLLDEHCRSSLADFQVPGCSVAVVVNQRIVYAKGFGSFDDSETGGWFSKSGNASKTVSADSVFPLGQSDVSEAILGLAVASLVEAKLLSWDAPLAAILPEVQIPAEYANSIVTISDLLSHRASLPRANLMSYLAAEISPDVIPQSLRAFPAVSCPQFRDVHARSVLTAPLASLVLRKVTQKPLEHVIQERVWAPVGASTKSGFTAEGKDDILTGLTSTARDLARLAAGLLGVWGPVNAVTLEEAWKPVGIVSTKECPEVAVFTAATDEERASLPMAPVRGFTVVKSGWTDSTYRGRQRIGLGGTGQSMSTQVCLFPSEGFGIIVLSTKRSLLPLSLANTIADFLLDVSPPAPWSSLLEKVPLPFTCTDSGLQAPISALGTLDSLSSYMGMYACPQVSQLMFKVNTQAGKPTLKFMSTQNNFTSPEVPLTIIKPDVMCFDPSEMIGTYWFPDRKCTLTFRRGESGANVEGFKLIEVVNGSTTEISFERLQNPIVNSTPGQIGILKPQDSTASITGGNATTVSSPADTIQPLTSTPGGSVHATGGGTNLPAPPRRVTRPTLPPIPGQPSPTSPSISSPSPGSMAPLNESQKLLSTTINPGNPPPLPTTPRPISRGASGASVTGPTAVGAAVPPSTTPDPIVPAIVNATPAPVPTGPPPSLPPRRPTSVVNKSAPASEQAPLAAISSSSSSSAMIPVNTGVTLTIPSDTPSTRSTTSTYVPSSMTFATAPHSPASTVTQEVNLNANNEEIDHTEHPPPYRGHSDHLVSDTEDEDEGKDDNDDDNEDEDEDDDLDNELADHAKTMSALDDLFDEMGMTEGNDEEKEESLI